MRPILLFSALLTFLTIFSCGKKSHKNNRNITDTPRETGEQVQDTLSDSPKDQSPPTTPRSPDASSPDPLPHIELTPSIIAECQTRWQAWQNVYVADSPFSAINKKWQWHVENREVEDMLNNDDFLVSLDTPLHLVNETYYEFDLEEISYKVAQQDSRDIEMERHIISLIERANSQDLNLILAGYFHIMDAHFALLKSEMSEKVGFTTFNIDDNTQRQTDAFYDFMAAIGKPKPKEYARDSSGMLMVAYSKIYLAQKSQPYSYAQAFPPETEHEIPNVFLIGDFHHIVESQFAESLPEPHCIEALGYKSVKFSFETLIKEKILYQTGRWYSYQDAFDSLDEIASFEQSNPGIVSQLKSQNPAAYDILINNTFFGDNIRNILKRLKLYRDYGIDVQFSGIE